MTAADANDRRFLRLPISFKPDAAEPRNGRSCISWPSCVAETNRAGRWDLSLRNLVMTKLWDSGVRCASFEMMRSLESRPYLSEYLTAGDHRAKTSHTKKPQLFIKLRLVVSSIRLCRIRKAQKFGRCVETTLGQCLSLVTWVYSAAERRTTTRPSLTTTGAVSASS